MKCSDAIRHILFIISRAVTLIDISNKYTIKTTEGFE